MASDTTHTRRWESTSTARQWRNASSAGPPIVCCSNLEPLRPFRQYGETCEGSVDDDGTVSLEARIFWKWTTRQRTGPRNSMIFAPALGFTVRYKGPEIRDGLVGKRLAGGAEPKQVVLFRSFVSAPVDRRGDADFREVGVPGWKGKASWEGIRLVPIATW
jgi:hypothetical protein